jgi:hypothetical protein
MSVEKLEPAISAVLEAASSYNTRAGEIIPLLGVQTKLGNRFRADELNAALEAMQERGWVEAAISTLLNHLGQRSKNVEILQARLDAKSYRLNIEPLVL